MRASISVRQIPGSRIAVLSGWAVSPSIATLSSKCLVLFSTPMNEAWECFPAGLPTKGVFKLLDLCQSEGEESTSMYLKLCECYYQSGWMSLHTFKSPCYFINAYFGVCLPHSKLSILRKGIIFYPSHTFLNSVENKKKLINIFNEWRTESLWFSLSSYYLSRFW